MIVFAKKICAVGKDGNHSKQTQTVYSTMKKVCVLGSVAIITSIVDYSVILLSADGSLFCPLLV